MAMKTVKDSNLPIFVKQVEVPAGTKTGAFVVVGSIRGLAIQDARVGENGKSYVTVDTAAYIRIDGVAEAFAVGAPVYVKTDGSFTGTATGNTAVGYTDREKPAVAGKLFVQLTPGVTA
ncbi:hypothetical protein CMP1-14 [Clavibacter phage CMP1]|uniref:DUF2190 family protein n=1 Tax=Clavibacter phage CMP1 TaxID=686439 RepID=D0U1Z8_9CAUD|nr:head decoration [Clavibacter phage CMP1]ACY35910.1 hypothetical protein CMP1-14 [Clavibacter phage CMP1]